MIRLRPGTGLPSTLEKSTTALTHNADDYSRPLPGKLDALVFAERCYWLVGLAASAGGKASCLPASLVLYRLLKRYRLPVSFRIGVNSRYQLFRAHAWVELDGKVLGPPADEFQAVEPVSDLQLT